MLEMAGYAQKIPDISLFPWFDSMAQKPDAVAGISAGAAYWIFFMLVFWLLGYPRYFSISLGAIAGIASGMIASWWKPIDEIERKRKKMTADKTPKTATPVRSPEADDDPDAIRRFPEYGVLGIRQRQRRQRKAVRRFSWWFRKGV